MKPAIFSELEFEVALERARDEKKMLLVDSTASWCGPCQVMDRTTWVDPKVVAAIEASAIAIQIDVDVQADLAARLVIKGMPTVVAFVDGIERDRVVGLQKTAELLAWLDGLSRGETSLQRLRRDVAAAPTDMHLRMDLARRLVDAQELDAATTECLWLWKNILTHQPSMYGVRLSFLAREIESLVQEHAPARAAFTALRDEVMPGDGTLDAEAVTDWFTLNEALGERQTSLAWFDAHQQRALSEPELRHRLELDVAPLLIEAGRWADVARLYPDPLARLRTSLYRRDEMLKQAATDSSPEGAAERLVKYANGQVRETAVRLLRALRAAGRMEEAARVAEEARRGDPSSEMEKALVEVVGLSSGSPATAPSPRPDVSHRAMTEGLLEKGWVDVYLAPRHQGVTVPPRFKVDVRLILRIGYKLAKPIPDLVVDDRGFSGTLSFDRQPFACSVPWSAVFAIVGEGGTGGVWDDATPKELKDGEGRQ